MADKTMKFDITAKDNASRTFAQVGVAVDRLSAKLDELGRKEVKPRVTADTERSKTRIEELGAALRALGNQRLRVDVDMGPGRSEVGDLRRELSLLRNVKVKVDLTAPPAAQVARVRQLREALRELDGINANATVAVVGNLPDAGELRRAARALKDLQDIQAIAIHISITGAVEALAQVAALRRELRAIPAQTTTKVNVDVDKGVLARLSGVGSALAKFGALGGLAAAGLASTTASAATLAGSLTSLIGLAPIAVAGLAGMATTAVVLKVGLAGVGDALKNIDDPKALAASLKELAPAAQKFVLAYKQVKPAFESVQLGVQQKLFDGLGTSVKQLSATYLPSMKTNLGGVATELNGVAKNVVAFGTSAQTIQDVNTIFDNTRVALHNAAPAANNILGTFRDIATVGSDFLPGLATGWTNATQRFQTFISEARESGQLKVWIQGGIDTLKTLGSISGNVGSVLMSVFTAAKASGADFLSTLEKVTGKLADLLASGTGQSALTAFFRESRQAIDALMPGVEALADGALRMIGSFSASGGLQTFAGTVSGIAQSLAPLLPMLGDLAGDVLKDLANGASLAAGALGPIVGAVTGVVGALGPLPALVLASVVAFKALGSAAVVGVFTSSAAALTRMSQSLAFASYGSGALAGAAGAASTATSRFATAVSKAGSALPLVGVALVVVGSLYEEFSGKADEAATKVLNGSESMQAAIAGEAEQIHKNQIEWLGGMNAQESYAAAAKNVTEEVAKQRAQLGPMAQLQSDVSRAQADLNDAVAQFGSTSPQAEAAGQRLAAVTQSLKTAHDGAAEAAKTQEEREQDLANSMAGQIGTALAYAQAVQRTAEAHKAADAALKSGGAQSEEYKGAVLSLAAAMASQADAARKQAEALGGTEAGVQAYNTEILRAADVSTKAGRDAFAQLADGLDDAGLAAITSTAKMSGLRTEIVTLPDGRKVTVVVEADRAKLDSVKEGVQEIAGKVFIGTVKILAETTNARGDITQTVELANGSRGTIKVDADGGPAILSVGQTKYTIDSTTGTLKVLGDVAPGETSLAGLKLLIDSTTGQMKLSADPAQANTTVAAWKALADGITGIPQLNANPAAANGVLQLWKSTSDATTGLPLIDANSGKATGVLAAWKALANGTTGIPALDSNPGLANQILAAWKARSDATTGLPKVIPQVQAGGAEAQLANLARTRYTTIVATVVAGQSGAVPTATGVKRIAGGAIGGIVRPYATGAVVERYAAGGIRPLRPMRGDIAQRVPANTWRVIGDRPRGLEYFLPDDSTPRSIKIGAEWAKNRGLALVPRSAGTQAAAGASRVTPPATRMVGALTQRVGGSATSSRPMTGPVVRAQLDDARLVAEIRGLHGVLAAISGDGSGDVVAELRALRPALLAAVKTSAAVSAQARRTDSELAGLR